jgi:hypothetical protein
MTFKPNCNEEKDPVKFDFLTEEDNNAIFNLVGGSRRKSQSDYSKRPVHLTNSQRVIDARPRVESGDKILDQVDYEE